MKKTVFAVLLMATGVATPAMLAAAPQEEAKTESSKEIVLNSFKDNWMISLEGGADFSLGRFDSNASFGKRIAPVFGLNVEKSACVWAPIITESKVPLCGGMGLAMKCSTTPIINNRMALLFPVSM